jgi:hypothetical protein
MRPGERGVEKMTVPEVVRPDLDFALDPLPDLHEVLDDFRKRGPVVPVLFATRPLWMIVGFEAVRAAMTDEAHLSTAEAYRRSLGRTMGPVMATMSGAGAWPTRSKRRPKRVAPST